jgi:hypothetical protein
MVKKLIKKIIIYPLVIGMIKACGKTLKFIIGLLI